MRKFSYVFNVERWLTRVLSEAELSPLVNYSQRKLYFQKDMYTNSSVDLDGGKWQMFSGRCRSREGAISFATCFNGRGCLLVGERELSEDLIRFCVLDLGAVIVFCVTAKILIANLLQVEVVQKVFALLAQNDAYLDWFARHYPNDPFTGFCDFIENSISIGAIILAILIASFYWFSARLVGRRIGFFSH